MGNALHACFSPDRFQTRVHSIAVFLCGGDPAMIVEPLRDEVEFSIKPATTDKA